MSDMSNVDFARENEEFAMNLADTFSNQNNWVVTVRFYSLLHYIEEILQNQGYNSSHHGDRKRNILQCPHTDDKLHRLYRRLEDASKDARYRCIRLSDDDVKVSEETLEEGKDILGFHGGSTTTKYST